MRPPRLARHPHRVVLVRPEILVMFLLLALYGGNGATQPPTPRPVSPEVDVTFVSAEIIRFPAPIHLGAGPTAITYQEALVLKLRVDRRAFDALPPSMDPYLYIGGREVRIFHIDRDESRNDLTLTFHIRDWTQLTEGAPFVLTIDHGAPVRDPDRFARVVGPRFSRQLIVDKR
jgi:hypothetical protein